VKQVPVVSRVKFTPAAPAEVATGLCGWIACVVDSLRIDGIALRRTRDGRYALTFPARLAGDGRRHAIVQPVSGAARTAVERQVLSLLDLPS
jgi:hypothetical protein